MLILRNDNVACRYRLKFPLSPVDFKEQPCPMSLSFWALIAVTKVHVALLNLRSSHVAVSNLGFAGLISDFGPGRGGPVPVSLISRRQLISRAGSKALLPTHPPRYTPIPTPTSDWADIKRGLCVPVFSPGLTGGVRIFRITWHI